MDNVAGIRLTGSVNGHLQQVERDLGVPIRLLDASNRMVVPTVDAREVVADTHGLPAYVLDPAYSGFDWRSENHPNDVQDFENGLTIFVRGVLGVPWNVDYSTVQADGALTRGSNGWNLAQLWGAISHTLLRSSTEYPVEDLDWANDHYVVPWPDWNGDDPFPLAEVASFEGYGRIMAFGFQPNRINTGDPARGRVRRELIWREAIEQAVGDLEEIRAAAQERARERFREFSTNRLGTRISEVRGRVNELENGLATTEESISNTRESLRNEKLTLDTLMRMAEGETPPSDPDTEWNAVENHAMVEKFTIQGNRFVIETTELTLTDPDNGRTAPLGKFRISFPMQPGSGRGVSMENLTNAKDDGTGVPRHHPHIAQNRPCFGSVMNEVARLGASGEVGGMLEVLLQYLQTFNPRDDYGRYAGLWFEGEVRRHRRPPETAQEVNE
jgi:hypothetical protein